MKRQANEIGMNEEEEAREGEKDEEKNGKSEERKREEKRERKLREGGKGRRNLGVIEKAVVKSFLCATGGGERGRGG